MSWCNNCACSSCVDIRAEFKITRGDSAWTKPIPNVDTTATRAVHDGFDPIKKPHYYNRFPNAVEPRHIAGHLTFHLGTALAYVARAGFKGDAAEDIRKAIVHLEFELERLGVKK